MKTLGKYEVLGEIAAGSMGVIYRARDPILDREVALKTIAGTGNIDPELKERFYREARAGARLHHPNVITVYDLGEQDGLVFIALELLSGCDLRQFIANRRELPVREKIEAMAAVCDGLYHAHRNGITHRDIKPSNVFLTDEGVPKLLDFGVARLSASQLTVVGRVLGTPYYMAPEQIMGQACDARSDLFSLALVTFEFLTYAHPFAGDSIPKRILNDNPDSLLSRNPELPPELDPILSKALAKDPAARYQNVEEFGQALRGVLRQAASPAPVRDVAPPPVPPPVPPPEALPANANTEFKMSAILLALQELDTAIEKRNVEMARNALAIVERLAKADDRFATAAKESRTRLSELEAALPPAPARVEPPAAPPPPRPTQPPAVSVTPPPARPAPAPVQVFSRPPVATPPVPAASRPPAATTPDQPVRESSGDDATSWFRAPASSAAPPPRPAPTTAPPAAPPPARATLPPAPVPRTMPPRPPVARTPPAAKSKSTVLIVAAAAAFLIIAVLVAFDLSSSSKPRKAELVPAVATAQVAAQKSAILSGPSDSASVVVSLKKGDTVNVIHPPRSASQDWTEVQYVAGNRAYPAGAMKTSDLTRWTSTKPDVALYLVEMYAPPDGAGEPELRQYAQSLTTFIQRFAGTSQQAEARAELDKTKAALASLGGPAPAPAPANETPAKPAAPAASNPSALAPEATLARAEKLWENGDYAQAERLLNRLLQQKPDFPAARIVLQKVQKARQLEGGK